VVPARRFAILERMGQFNRVLMPGVHWYTPWVEYVKSVRWTHMGQNEELVVRDEQLLSFDKAQMDLPPVRCITKDQIMVTVDGTLMYHITRPQAAVYETDDVMNLFWQCTQQGIRNTVSSFMASELQGKDNEIGLRVQTYVNEKITEAKGVSCDMFVVQSVAMDPKILEANQQIYVRSRQAQMALEEQDSEHRKHMAALQQRSEKERIEQEIEERAKTFAVRIRAVEASAKAEAEKRSGWTVDQLLEQERIQAMAKIGAKAQKVIYAPFEYWSAGKRIVTANE